MALTRKFLTALGIEADKVDEIIEAHSETVTALKEERDSYKADADKLKDTEKELTEAKKTIEAQGTNEFEAKYNELKKEFEGYKAEQDAKAAASKKESAYKALLKEAGVSEKRIDSIMRVTKLDEIELEGDKIKDSETLTKNIKEEWKDFLTTKSTEGAGTEFPPVGGEGALTKEQIYAKDERGKYKLSTQERLKALAELNE